MIIIDLFGFLVLSVLLAYKINFFVLVSQGKETTKITHNLKKLIGWPIGITIGAMSALAVYILEIPGYYIQLVDLLITLVFIAIIDLKWKIIPNSLNLAFLFSQMIASLTFSKTYINIWNLVISFIILLILMFISKMSKEQIGMGDVKLITIINLVYGLTFTMYSLIFSLFAMLLFCIPLLIMKKVKMKSQIPFGPFYTLGTTIYIIMNLI